MNTYTADDVYAVHFAKITRASAKTEHDTPENIIYSFIDSGNETEDRREFAEQWQKFRRGAAILDAGYTVTYSDSHVQMLGSHADQIERRRPVSPVVSMAADYIGTTQQYCYAAIVKTK